MKKKRVIVLLMFILVSLLTFVIAESASGNVNNSENQIGGDSCGTVTPGEQEECCINKGYEGWNEGEFKCMGEGNQNIQTQNQNQVSATYKKGNLTQEQIKNIIQTRNRIKTHYANQSECPTNCTCSGSTIKCEFESGRTMTVYAGNSGNTIVQIKNVNASTNIALYKSEDGKIYGIFKNNETKEIILPDEVKERIQNRTRVRLQNETMNLTEDGYIVRAHKKARLFWIFPVKEHVRAQVDAETGEIIKVKSSWWGFLARDIREA